MGIDIRILLPEGELRAQLDDSSTAAAIEAALPLEAEASRWGEEVYFTIPVQVEEAPDARQDMAVGELGYWPLGAAFCIFFGATPASTGSEPRAYSNVNPFGRIHADSNTMKRVLGKVGDGDVIRVDSA